jgi:hypothetical protein
MVSKDVYPWVVLEDLNRFLLKDGIKQYHPDDPRHLNYWRELKRNCVEGLWGEDWNEFRYMPGRLFFYGTFGTIIDTDQDEKTRRLVRPDVRDIEWERAYNYAVCEGFSGFSEDDLYTSDESIFRVKKNFHPSSVTDNPRFFSKNGKFKEYIDPRENIKRLHKFSKGHPWYYNENKNLIELGSRGGGKSYWYAIAGAQYRLVFDGIKYYTEHNIQNPPTVEILVGSGKSDKSSEFCRKIRTSMQMLGQLNELGAWGKKTDEDFIPSPLYKNMKGSISANNKDNAWRHEYEVESNGLWMGGFGTLSALYHTVYSTNKRDGAESGAGGRYTDLYYEESGLTELLIEAYSSNVATTMASGVFGSHFFLGTSGNMETVLPSKKIFENPENYGCLAFDDVWEGSGKIGFFLPSYITDRRFKDKNGNTDIDAAREYFNDRIKKAKKVDDPAILRGERMNFPQKPSDMWQTQEGTLLPAAEAEEREKELVKKQLYKKLGLSIKLFWSDTNVKGIDYEIQHDADPFFEWPLETNQQRTDWSGSIQIFDFPYVKDGTTPNDMYFVTHDPYVSDEWDKGGSLGVAHVWMNPKYWSTHIPSTGPLVATYIGKARGGKKEYYQNLEKLLAFYGNPLRGLAYEANRGEFCRSYFIKNKKTYLLALRPQYQQGSSVYQQKVTQYGYIVGNNIQKIEMLDSTSDFLLQELEINGEKKRLIHTIPCLFTVRQIKGFNIKGNFDAVSSVMLAPTFIGEYEHMLLNQKKIKQKSNPLSFFTKNPRLTNTR